MQLYTSINLKGATKIEVTKATASAKGEIGAFLSAMDNNDNSIGGFFYGTPDQIRTLANGLLALCPVELPEQPTADDEAAEALMQNNANRENVVELEVKNERIAS
jgi:hypothetical protein